MDDDDDDCGSNCKTPCCGYKTEHETGVCHECRTRPERVVFLAEVQATADRQRTEAVAAMILAGAEQALMRGVLARATTALERARGATPSARTLALREALAAILEPVDETRAAMPGNEWLR